jgi:signal transduction histidine kinase
MEGALQRALTDLERQNAALLKVDTIKDGLIRDVTHELKTPVAKHSMQIELLKEILGRHGLTEESRGIIDVMENTIRRQEHVIRNILNLSRLEGGGRRYTVESVPLDRLLDQVIEDYRYTIDAHGVVVTRDIEPVEVTSDREMLWHVFSNLLSNAIKFRQEGVPSHIDISLRREGDRVRLTVRDNGVGLSAEDRERAFERFYQGSAHFEGSGVGLNIARKIVTDLGGTITLDSPGKGLGAVATVILPPTIEAPTA